MINVLTPYCYHGEGTVLISERTSQGLPFGYRAIGRVSSLDLLIADTMKEHFDSQTSNPGRDAIYPAFSKVDIQMIVDQIVPENLALFWGGSYEKITGAQAEKTLAVQPGYRYALDHVNVSKVVILNAGSGALFVEDLDYKLNPATGGIEILLSGGIGAISLSVSYEFGDQSELQYGISSRKEYCLRFEGLNIAESNSPVVLECYRVGFYVLNQFRVQGQSSSNITVKGALMRDAFRPEGSQFFRELLV